MLRVIPLGGLGEIGMNCLALEQDGDALVVDCGVLFDDRGLGIDVIHPELSALERFRVAGIVLTHGHEDHIGGLPYFLKRFDVPVWGGRYALGLVRERSLEHEVLGHARLNEMTPRSPFEVGPFQVEPIRVTHSIADAFALAIRTSLGTVLHTGDFKLDPEPVDGEGFDMDRMRAIGEDGVALMLSDSTNADVAGHAGSEQSVGDRLGEIVAGAEQAVVVCMFASNVHRLRMLGQVARKNGRRLVLLGRSVQTHSRVARETGYLDWPSDLVFPSDRARELPRRSILAIATGSQAEPDSALARLARGEHPALDLVEGDEVVLSARAIPGREPKIYEILSALLRRGVIVHSRATDARIHVSGHAHRDEQRTLIDVLRPRAFIPIHGTRHHLVHHAATARASGVGRVGVLEDGEVGVATEASLSLGERVRAGRVHVNAGREIPEAVLRERAQLAEGGMVAAAVLLVPQGPTLVLQTFGILQEPADTPLLEATRRAALDAVDPGDSDETIEDSVRSAIRRVLAQALGYKPLTRVEVRRAGHARESTA
jgi:ribonuclease J